MSDTFCGLPIVQDPLLRNAKVIPGKNFGAYCDIMSRIDQAEIKTYDEPLIVECDPEDINGISMSVYDSTHPDSFWAQHKQGGTLESFAAIASQIDDVRKMLQDGKALDDLKRDPEYGPCARLYFDTNARDFAEAYDCGNFFWFQTNGRHRLLAARLAGKKIRIKIIGTMTG